MTGYWYQRGFFRAYVAGRCIGAFPMPEQAESALRVAGAV